MCLDRKKKAAFIALVAALGLAPLAAREKFALVIGNAAYTTISRLRNPVNDANDMAAALESLGWTVEKVLDGDQARMEDAAARLKARLSGARDSYGLLFYAGHGVQSDGENYLIPVDANIPAESYLRNRAVPLRAILGDLNNAGNALNVIILDACRDNPFAWSGSRSGASRGLSVVGVQPADSIVVYATGAGSVASDGTGRNGLFTTHLLRYLKTPGISVRDLFDKTGADVQQASNGAQIPAVYSQFFGTAYLGSAGTTPTPSPSPAPAPSGDAAAFFNQGKAHYDNKDYDRAIASFTEALRLVSDNASYYNWRGDAYYYKEDYDRAIADYTAALRIDPNNAYAYYSRGAAYYFKKDYDRAIASFTEALRLVSDNASYYNWRGDAYYYKEDYDRAIADYTAALHIDPNNAYAYYSRGAAYYFKKDYDSAIASFTEALRVDPNYSNSKTWLAAAYNNRGYEYNNKGDYDRAIADHTTALLINPNYAAAYNWRGAAYSSKGDYDRAITDFTAALRINPNDAVIKGNLENARKARAQR